MNKVLVTGGCGFIGSHFIDLIYDDVVGINQDEGVIVNLDKLDIGSNVENNHLVNNEKGYILIQGDICDKASLQRCIDHLGGYPDKIINFAAQSHVDRSIEDSESFIKTNVEGVRQLLELCRKNPSTRFVQISTDEVYGDTELGSNYQFRENDALNPRNPYAASKASAEHLVRSYKNTYGLNAVITRSSNNYGYRQHPEKLLPKVVNNILDNKKVPLYGSGSNIRDWLYVWTNCRAIRWVMDHEDPSLDVFNIGGKNEWSNAEVIKKICDIMNVNFDDVVEFVDDRPGHDKRYSVSVQRITRYGFRLPEPNFDHNLIYTIDRIKRERKNED